jgi:transforming growth factor-beta-induced protein
VKAGLAGALSGAGPFTVFAPTNDAFLLLNQTLVSELNADELGGILKYHVLADRITSINLASLGRSWTTLQGAAVSVSSGPAAAVQVDFADVSLVVRDVECSNGVVHVIDRVLSPPPF